MVSVYTRTYVGWDGRHTKVGDQAVRAKWDGYVSTGEHFKHSICGSLDAGIDEVGAIAGTPAAGDVGQPVSDGHYGYNGRSSYVGANGCYEHAIWDGRPASEFLHLEPLLGLPLLAPLGNMHPTGVTSKPMGVAGLAPSGVASTPFR